MTTDQINYWTLQEQKRHNAKIEEYNTNYLSETVRSHMATEQLTLMANLETARHNAAWETETNRHNVVSENQAWSSLNETQRHNKAMEGLQASSIALGYQQLAETARHNVETENLTSRAQLEQWRSNVASEDIRRRQNELTKEANDIALRNANIRGLDVLADFIVGNRNANIRVGEWISNSFYQSNQSFNNLLRSFGEIIPDGLL